MKKYLKRFKNPLLISSLLSFIFIILNLLGIVNFSNEKIDFIINSILSILILLGLVNNPENKEKITTFKDIDEIIYQDQYKNFKNSNFTSDSNNFENQDDWS